MDFKAFKEKVMSDKAFAAEFAGKKPSEVVELAKAKGYNISTSDLKANLNDDDLDVIAGGGHILGAGWFVQNATPNA